MPKVPSEQAVGVTPKALLLQSLSPGESAGVPLTTPQPLARSSARRGMRSGSPAAGLGVWGPGSSLNPDCHTSGPRSEERSEAHAKCFQGRITFDSTGWAPGSVGLPVGSILLPVDPTLLPVDSTG